MDAAAAAGVEDGEVEKSDRASAVSFWLWRWQYLTRVTIVMVKSVEGIYRNGKVELVEPLMEAEGSRVIVTWVHPAEPVDLRERGIPEPEAADLRRRLATFAEDWDRPEMAVYDDLPTR
jgi:hypothetical protein